MYSLTLIYIRIYAFQWTPVFLMQNLVVVGRRPVHKVRGQSSAFCQQIQSGWSQSCKTYFPSGETLEGHDTPYECLDHSYVAQSI